jgi:hypothetical protein
VKPTVLIASAYRWLPTARLAVALDKVGCRVETVCPAGHPLRVTSVVRGAHTFSSLAPLASLENAISATSPDLIISGDDLATRHFHRLYQYVRARGKKGEATCSLIERSFGLPDSFPVVYERAAFIRLAQQQGVRVPTTAVLANLEELRRWGNDAGFPTVLKVDGTSGGEGVRIARNREEAEGAFRKLHAPPLVARAAKRALVDHDSSLVWASLLRRRCTVNAQTLVMGHDATSTVACWRGSVLAALHFEVLNKRDAAGPATVMRVIDNLEMTSAVEKVVRRLGLSGIHGFDFVIESRTGHAFLIEINPRITQVAHLALGPGRDLASALKTALTGDSGPSATITDNPTIALFPQEWMRDPASRFLQSAHHDVPWDEPGLIRVCVQHARKQNPSIAQEDGDRAFLKLMRTCQQQSNAITPHAGQFRS